MKKTVSTAAIRSITARPALGLLAAALLLAGCGSLAPAPLTEEEVTNRVKQDVSQMYAEQVPIQGALSLEEAMARALKYNLDYRLKKMESALALGLADYASYDMLPQLLLSAGYRARDSDSGGHSRGILDGVDSTRPTTSDERRYRQAGAEFSWNALDFGVSYYRARQQSNQFLVAEERRRKVVQNLLQDVRASYWRALGAQRLADQAQAVLERANAAMNRSREAESQKVIPPSVALAYQRALLDATGLLNQRRQDLEFAKREILALVNAPPATQLRLAEVPESKLPAAPRDVGKLEELTLLQRPELREEDLRRRITADETRKQLAGMLPNLSVNLGLQHNSNRLLYDNTWGQGGAQVSWNLLRLLALPSLNETRDQQVKADDTRRMALSMAILTQLRVAAERYNLALEDFRLADQAAQVDGRLATFTRAAVTARLDSELEAVRTQARAVLGDYQRANAYANAQIALGRLYNTLGFDPLPADFDNKDLAGLTQSIKAHLASTETEAFKFSSNLFPQAPSVSLQVSGVGDTAEQARLKAQLRQVFERHAVRVDDQGGQPMVFALDKTKANGLEKARWTIQWAPTGGTAKGQTQYTTTLPVGARSSALDATLVAAATAKMGEMRGWLEGAPTPQGAQENSGASPRFLEKASE